MADYVTLKVTSAGRGAFQRLALEQSVKLDRRVSLGEIAIAAAAVAKRHPEELAAELTGAAHTEEEQGA
jgi:hypothetical protein